MSTAAASLGLPGELAHPGRPAVAVELERERFERLALLLGVTVVARTLDALQGQLES